MIEINKVLVCITPQSNSKRLIDRGFEISCSLNGELHILHVEKGNNLFVTKDSTELLQRLFDYGSELGGTVHGLCGEDISHTIINFTKEKKITNILLGEAPKNAVIKSSDVADKIKTTLPYLDIEILNREN